MLISTPSPTRFFGLDIHKHYLVAVAVHADGQQVYGPRKVTWEYLETWRAKTLTPADAVVIEMTSFRRNAQHLAGVR